ncbi:hypothetical protein GWK16_23860 [Roseomonas sp. JC162]|uniref:RFX1-4/6/8-like BCD domain-containing protein n=1 Tax=Neoroseomonas marina TaxID=1232220 RepID=A0A848EI14_9PROT|nr:hypothetical protein [Neoroseomonas marina]NMJ44304.1 hypothetical protein [Neoroseomonas marina]
MKGALFAVLVEFLAQDEAKPMAERITSEVQTILKRLESVVAKAIKDERAKIAEQKAEMIEGMKEELRRSVIAQKSLTTRQVNQSIAVQEQENQVLLASMERRLNAAGAAAEARVVAKQDKLLTELSAAIDRLLAERLQAFAFAAVKQHIRERPIFDAHHTNRELASINGISIREVKRRRRAAP